MDSRIVLHALTPPPALFSAAITQPLTTSLTRPSDSHNPTQPSPSCLRHSIRLNFPPPPPPPSLSSCHLDRLFKPHSLPELQRAILYARRQRRRLRPVVLGTSPHLHSSHVAFLFGGGVLVDMNALNKVQLYRKRAVVVAQAGVLLKDLDHELGQYLSQRVNVDAAIGVNSLGGAFVRGVFGGGGVTEGLLGDVVSEVSFVDAFGRLRVESGHGAAWNAVKMSLGLFGVVYDVTLNVDAWRRLVRVGSSFVTMRGLVGARVPLSVRGVVEERGAVELTWVPFNSFRCDVGWCVEEDVCWVRTLERVGSREEGVECDEEHDVVYRFLTVPQWLSVNAGVLEKGGYVKYRPEHAKVILGVGFEETAWKLETKPYVQTVAHAVRWQDSPEAFPVAEVGVGLPLRLGKEEDWDIVQEAWKVVMRKVEEYDSRKEYPLNVGMKTTFVKASDALLAANFAYSERGRRNGTSAMVRIVTARNTLGWEQFAREVVEEWMKLPGARCQLSRDMAAICSADMIAKSLGESLQSFLKARKKAAVDDYGMFLDEPFAELLGLCSKIGEFHSSPVSSIGSTMHANGQLDDMDQLIGTERVEERSEARGGCEQVNAIVRSQRPDYNYDEIPSAYVSQSSVPCTPKSGTPQLFASPVPSRNSFSDDTDGLYDDEGYDGDDDGSDVALSHIRSTKMSKRFHTSISVPRHRRMIRQTRPGRRRQYVAGRPPTSVADVLLFLAYVGAAVLIGRWVFGELAVPRIVWPS